MPDTPIICLPPSDKNEPGFNLEKLKIIFQELSGYRVSR